MKLTIQEKREYLKYILCDEELVNKSSDLMVKFWYFMFNRLIEKLPN